MVGTSYFTIYKRAITEFKDPTLKQLLESNPILFSEAMYNFLENAISLFTNPLKASQRVKDRRQPYTYQNNFNGDNNTDVFTLTNFPDDEIISECIISCKVNGKNSEYTYNEIEHSVSFDIPPPNESIIQFDIYYIGNWNIDLYDGEIYILSQFLMSCWSEYVNNDKLDIIRLLGDTDFKLSSNASTTQSKVNWNIVNRETVQKRMNKYAWDSRSMGLYR